MTPRPIAICICDNVQEANAKLQEAWKEAKKIEFKSTSNLKHLSSE